MRKVTAEQIARKREEIINACEQLYQTMSFREITLKEIGRITCILTWKNGCDSMRLRQNAFVKSIRKTVLI